MGFRALFAGMLFLCNPSLLSLDFIPDFIGYAIMIYGMRKLRDLSPEMEVARRGFIRMMLISLSKLILTLLFLRNTDGGYLMIITFVYAIAESVVGISVFSHFFSGMTYLASRYDSESSLKKMTSFQYTTYVWIVVSAVTAFLPQVAFLWIDEYQGYVLGPYQLPLYILAFTAGLCVGIRYFISMRGFRRTLFCDGDFHEKIQRDYRERIAPQTNMFLSRRLRIALLYLAFGLCLMYDFFMDGINFIPDVISGALLLCGFAFLARKCRYAKLGMILSGVYAVYSVFTFLYSAVLARRYYNISLAVSPAAYREFLSNVGVYVVDTLLSVALLVCVYLCLLSFIRKYTVHNESGELESIKARDRAQRKSFYTRSTLCLALGLAAIASGLINFICLYLLPEYWMYHMIPSAIWIASIISLFSAMREYVGNRYV